MAIRNIVKDTDDILRCKCRAVEEFNAKLHNLLDDMRDTMYKADGVGLAGPQVGILRRVAVVEVDDVYVELINPRIVECTGEQISEEACLSVPNKSCLVNRPLDVKVEHYDRFGNKKITAAHGLCARAFCHEIDHLDGILFYDKEYKG